MAISCYFCDRPAETKAMCAAHYARWLQGLRGAELTAPIGTLKRKPKIKRKQCKANCDRIAVSRGYCPGHYFRWKKGLRGEALDAPLRGYNVQKPICKAPNCDRAGRKRGMCNRHYMQWWLKNRRKAS